MNKNPLVLVVDDEPSLLDALKATLRQRGFAFESATTGEAALMLTASLSPDAIILDLGLPDMDGKAVIAALRHGGHAVPIVVLSARDQEQEKVAALDAGADDYLSKPFGAEELAARLRAVLRRQTPPGSQEKQWFGDLEWDPDGHRVSFRGQEIHLTPLEYRLFAYLASHAGRLITHGTLLREVWGLGSLENVHYVRIAVAALRKELEAITGRRDLIVTEVGTGYRFRGEVPPVSPERRS